MYAKLPNWKQHARRMENNKPRENVSEEEPHLTTLSVVQNRQRRMRE